MNIESINRICEALTASVDRVASAYEYTTMVEMGGFVVGVPMTVVAVGFLVHILIHQYD